MSGPVIDPALLERILADPAWTRRVVVAAAHARHALEGPEITSDGDDHRLPATTALRTAFVDEDAIPRWRGAT